MLRFEISCWASDVGTGIQSRRRAASLGGSFTRTVYLNSKARDGPEAGASAGPPAARAADATSAVAVTDIPRLSMRRIVVSRRGKQHSMAAWLRSREAIAAGDRRLRAQPGRRDGKSADAPPRRGEHGVRDGGGDGPDRVFSESRGGRLAGNDVGLDRGRLVHAHDLEVGVALLTRPAVAEVDLSVQGGRESPGDSALDLALETGQVDRHSAIDDARDAVHPKIAEVARDGHLGHLGDVALAEVGVDGHAASPQPILRGGQGSGPAGLVPGDLQNFDHPTAIDALIAELQDVPGLEQVDAQPQRVLPSRTGDLVDERLAGEDTRGILHGAP